jgi:pimeloyl-ACP methyl ester carboxylesterase
MEPTSRRLELATGLGYHLLEWDQVESDHTVVLVHGFLDLAWGWAATVREGLARRYHVIAPDMRGHGDSDRVGAGGYYYFFDYVADLTSVIEQLGRDRVSLVGHSMGGSITSYYAGAYPESVHRLALLEGLGPPESDTPPPERVKHWIAAWKRARARKGQGYASIGEAAGRLRKHDPLLSEALALELAERGTRAGADGRLHFKHDPLHLTMGPYPYSLAMASSFWKSITCPVLLVAASQSRLRHAGDEYEQRASNFSDARSVVIDDAAHMMQRHKPRELAEILIDFLG